MREIIIAGKLNINKTLIYMYRCITNYMYNASPFPVLRCLSLDDAHGSVRPVASVIPTPVSCKISISIIVMHRKSLSHHIFCKFHGCVHLQVDVISQAVKLAYPSNRHAENFNHYVIYC